MAEPGGTLDAERQHIQLLQRPLSRMTKDCFIQAGRGRLYGKGGEVHEMPTFHNLVRYR